jgi:hypothetical protein
MASVPKMSLKIAESIVPVGMQEPFACLKNHHAQDSGVDQAMRLSRFKWSFAGNEWLA